VEHRVAEVTALLAASEREAATAAERLARVKGDYLSGELTAAEWRELRSKLEPAAEAAAGARDRLAAQLAEVEAGPSLAGLESELLAKLAQVRAAITGEVTDAAGVDAARSALMRVFGHFLLHQGRPEGAANLELIAEGYWIEPVVSDEAVDGYDEKLRPRPDPETDCRGRGGVPPAMAAPMRKTILRRSLVYDDCLAQSLSAHSPRAPGGPDRRFVCPNNCLLSARRVPRCISCLIGDGGRCRVAKPNSSSVARHRFLLGASAGAAAVVPLRIRGGAGRQTGNCPAGNRPP
jgi:hypothetical protein